MTFFFFFLGFSRCLMSRKHLLNIDPHFLNRRLGSYITSIVFPFLFFLFLPTFCFFFTYDIDAAIRNTGSLLSIPPSLWFIHLMIFSGVLDLPRERMSRLVVPHLLVLIVPRLCLEWLSPLVLLFPPSSFAKANTAPG